MSLFLRWTFVFEHAIAVALDPIFSLYMKKIQISYKLVCLTDLKLKNFKMREQCRDTPY